MHVKFDWVKYLILHYFSLCFEVEVLASLIMITQKDLWKCIAQCKSEIKRETVKDISSYVFHIHNLQLEESDIREQRRALEGRYKKYNSKKTYQTIAEEDGSDDIEYQGYYTPKESNQPGKGSTSVDDTLQHGDNPAAASSDEDGEGPSAPKKRRKAFQQLGYVQQRENTEKLIKKIDEFIESDCEGKLTTTQLLGYLLMRENRKDNKVRI